MLLVGYLYGIKSERRLVHEIQLNIAYRWFCGFELADKIPDHSTFSKTRMLTWADTMMRLPVSFCWWTIKLPNVFVKHSKALICVGLQLTAYILQLRRPAGCPPHREWRQTRCHRAEIFAHLHQNRTQEPIIYRLCTNADIDFCHAGGMTFPVAIRNYSSIRCKNNSSMSASVGFIGRSTLSSEYTADLPPSNVILISGESRPLS